jgi:hypothetical protein
LGDYKCVWPYEGREKGEFLQELYKKYEVSGAHCNLWGFQHEYNHEKSYGASHNIWMDMFNNFIEDTTLREIKKVGGRFTWINKQRGPVMSNLDRFFVSRDWEQRYPKVLVRTLTRVGLDHNPILLDDGVEST